MNTNREAKVNMYHSVTDLCDNSLAIIALVVAFETSYNIFKTTVTAIAVGMMNLSAQTGGYRVAKKGAKSTMATMGSGIAGMVFAYASVTNNAVLKSSMKITKSKILKALDDDVQGICMNIYNAANDNLANLGDYGVTAPLLATFLTVINDYTNKAPKPKQAKNYKQMVESQVKQMIKDADVVLKEQMDMLVGNFLSNGNEEFEGQYRQARKKIDAGAFSTVLKIKVVNKVNDDVIRNVKVYRDESPDFKRTTAKGFVTFKDIEQGAHTFVLKHKLFEDLTLSGVMISYGKKQEVTAKMNPVGTAEGATINREGTLPSPGIAEIVLSGVHGNSSSTLTITLSAMLRVYAAANSTNPPGSTFIDIPAGTHSYNLDEFGPLVGFDDNHTHLLIQNIGMSAVTYKFTFENV